MLSIPHINRRRRIGGGGGGADPDAIQFVAASDSVLTTCDWPTGIETGDLVFAFQVVDTGTLTVPTNFTQIYNQGVETSLTTMLAYHVYDSATSGANISGVTSDADGRFVAVAFRGQNAVTPFSDNALASGTTGMPTPPSIESSGPGTIVVFGGLDDDVLNMVVPNGYSEAFSGSTGSAGAGTSNAIGYLYGQNTGTQSPAAFTGAGDDFWVGITLCVRQ